MIGIPRPKERKCEFCCGIGPDDINEKELETHVYGEEEVQVDGSWEQNDIGLPDNVTLTSVLTARFGLDKNGKVKVDGNGYIEEVVPIIETCIADHDAEASRFIAMDIEIRYCPYCGRDLYEALN